MGSSTRSIWLAAVLLAACGGAKSFNEDAGDDVSEETTGDAGVDVSPDVVHDTIDDGAADIPADTEMDVAADTAVETIDVVTDIAEESTDTFTDPGCDPAVWHVYHSTDTPLAIPDDDTVGVRSAIAVDDCDMEVLDLTVEVHVAHGYIGDLTIVLLAPTGDEFVLHEKEGGTDDDIDETYPTTAPPSRSMCAVLPVGSVGTWQLWLTDDLPGDSGILTSWTLSLRGTAGACPSDGYTSTDTFPIAIPDDDMMGIESTIVVDDPGTIASVAVLVDIEHEWIGDLVVYLESPGGVDVLLHDRSGGSGELIDTVYPVETTPAESLSAYTGLSRTGTWTLHVEDTASAFTGTLEGWQLYIE